MIKAEKFVQRASNPLAKGIPIRVALNSLPSPACKNQLQRHPRLAAIQSDANIRFPDTTTGLSALQSPSTYNSKNIETSKGESHFLTVSCILHTLRMSRLVLHRNTLKHNDFLPPAPHGSIEGLSKIFPIDGGTDRKRFFLTYGKKKNIQLPDQTGADLRLRQPPAARYEK
ncbi:MAG: hypothetical protein ACREFR_15875 [Limisphaerales bacterium]